MTYVGEIKRGNDITPPKEYRKYIWVACPQCGKERWVRLENGSPRRLYCHKCAAETAGLKVRGEYHHLWKGGRYKKSDGYISMAISPNDSFYQMANKQNHVLEHRLVMARDLGRCLLSSEEVHHINGVKDDNRIENLELLSRASHAIYNKLCHNCELRREIRLLRWQVKELSEALQIKLGAGI